MILSERLKFIFIHIPKTGGESICKALESLISQTFDKHLKIRHVDKRIDLQKYYKFTFVRNPWDQVVSFYEHLRKPLWPCYKKNPNLLYCGQRILNPVFAGRLALELDFKEYVEKLYIPALLNEKGYVNNKEQKHLYLIQPQSTWITDTAGNLSVDYIGRFENLEKDFRKICNFLDIQCELGHVNYSRRNNSYQSYYDSKTIGIIGDYFAEDIKRFGYKFED